jgi:hypothetical protein
VSLIATLPKNRGGTSASRSTPTRAALRRGCRGGVRLWDASPDQRLEAVGIHLGQS